MDPDSFAEIIFNSIVEYAFNEFEITGKDYSALHAVALKSKLKYNEDSDETAKIKYGFYGEVILFSILMVLYKAKPVIARGYFYNPLENAETKGYDSYQLVENNGQTELWFGEVKFHKNHKQAIKSVLSNIEKALSDDYFERNVIAIHNHKNNLNISNTVVEKIINEWETNPIISIIEQAKKHNIRLIYPILLLYEEDSTGYDANIKKVPDHIQTDYSLKTLTLSIDYSIFFILLPIKDVIAVKKQVISWIESKKQPLS
ncbi:HamA C-terminal domain-containing protein [Dyadobacter sp.]|uniref:HamA C-terminal domain-containing protein n=1 Tax=Dyadobacter sp. TaxID=1914288 RepID=UPI003F710556